MSHFNGTWKTILEERDGFDVFMKELGLPPDMIDSFREVTTVLTYKVSGDTWEITADMKNLKDKAQADAIKPKTYTLKLGQELNDTDLTGGKFKMLMTLGPDGKMTEKNSSETTGWKELISKRSVKGDKMIQEQEVTVDGKKFKWMEVFKKV